MSIIMSQCNSIAQLFSDVYYKQLVNYCQLMLTVYHLGYHPLYIAGESRGARGPWPLLNFKAFHRNLILQ